MRSRDCRCFAPSSSLRVQPVISNPSSRGSAGEDRRNSMWLVALALRRPFTVLVVVVAILVGSFLTLRKAPADIFPSLGVPVVYVVQPYGGMSPTQMEGQLI